MFSIFSFLLSDLFERSWRQLNPYLLKITNNAQLFEDRSSDFHFTSITDSLRPIEGLAIHIAGMARASRVGRFGIQRNGRNGRRDEMFFSSPALRDTPNSPPVDFPALKVVLYLSQSLFCQPNPSAVQWSNGENPSIRVSAKFLSTNPAKCFIRVGGVADVFDGFFPSIFDTLLYRTLRTLVSR